MNKEKKDKRKGRRISGRRTRRIRRRRMRNKVTFPLQVGSCHPAKSK